MSKANRNVETIDVIHEISGATIQERLGYFAYSLGVHNKTGESITVYLSQYSEDSIVLDAGDYREVAVTTNYYRVVPTASTGEVIVTIVRSAVVDSFLTPLFPNLYAPAGEIDHTEDIKLNPISAYGYSYTPWYTNDGNVSVGENTAIAEMEFYLGGRVVSATNSQDFYTDVYNEVLLHLTAVQPIDYVPPTNPEYSPAQAAEVVKKVKAYLDSLDTPIHQEFLGGYAGLSNSSVSLISGGDYGKFQTPWTVLSTVVYGSVNSGATLRYTDALAEDLDDTVWTEVTVPAGGVVEIDSPAVAFEVILGAATLSFDPNDVKMIEFAPILNIMYPMGFTETEGLPEESFATFKQSLEKFKQTLEVSKFTGRVIYFRVKPFHAQPAPVYTADNVLPKDVTGPVKYVFAEIQHLVQNYYQYSKLEEDLLVPITYENRSNYYNAIGEPIKPLPKTLEEVIEDDGVKFRGISGAEAKKAFIIKLLLEEYNGAYSMGGVKHFTQGSMYGRVYDH